MPVAQLRGAEPAMDPQPKRWYRVGYYGANKQSHRICDEDRSIFWCGRIVWPEPDQLDAAGITDPWLIYEEGRKNPSRCSACSERGRRYDATGRHRERARAKAEGQILYDRLVTFDDLMEMAEEMDVKASAARGLGI